MLHLNITPLPVLPPASFINLINMIFDNRICWSQDQQKLRKQKMAHGKFLSNVMAVDGGLSTVDYCRSVSYKHFLNYQSKRYLSYQQYFSTGSFIKFFTQLMLLSCCNHQFCNRENTKFVSTYRCRFTISPEAGSYR